MEPNPLNIYLEKTILMAKFKINPKNETAFSLEQKSQIYLFNLFKEIMGIYISKKKVRRQKQSKKSGKYLSKKHFEKLRKIKKKMIH